MTQGLRKFLIVCGIVISVGLLLSLIGWILGGIRGLIGVEDKVSWISFGGHGEEARTMKVEPFSSIDLDCDMGSVELIRSDNFSVELNYDKKIGAPEVEVEGGTLAVTSQAHRDWWFDLSIFKGRDYADTKVKIYYPEGTVFKNVQLENDMGDLNLKGIQAENVDVASNCGDVKLDGVIADSLRIDCDMGSTDARNIQTKGVDVEANMGNVKLAGALGGITKISCDMGECVLETELDKKSYSIHTDIDMGDCSIDGQDVGSAHTIVNDAAENKIEVESNAGDVEINFR